MSKYDKLGGHLSRARANVVRLSFKEIEAIIGTALPASKAYAAWWSNNPWNNVMTKVWLDAGFKSARVDVAAETIEFIRVTAAAPTADKLAAAAFPRSPLFGLMKGTSITAPGVDLTAPADPEWAKVYDEDYLPPAARDILANPTLNISDKIRRLDQMGLARAAIAKLLNKRYQHVRNVLIAEQRKAG